MSKKAKKRKVLRSIGLEPTVVRKQNSAFNPFQAQKVFGCSAKLFGRGGKCSAVRQIGGRVGICSVLGNSTKPISPRVKMQRNLMEVFKRQILSFFVCVRILLICDINIGVVDVLRHFQSLT